MQINWLDLSCTVSMMSEISTLLVGSIALCDERFVNFDVVACVEM